MLKFVDANVRLGFLKSNTLPKIMKKDIIIGALLLIIGFVVGLLFRPRHLNEPTTEIREVVRVDTITIEKPSETRIERLTETINVVVSDTIRLKDTLYVQLPLQKRVYKRDDFYAEVVGYEPRLTKIQVYPKTVYVKESVSPTNQLALGFEMQFNGNASIPIYLEYSHLLHRNVKMFGKVMYDLPTQQIGVGMGMQIQFGW